MHVRAPSETTKTDPAAAPAGGQTAGRDRPAGAPQARGPRLLAWLALLALVLSAVVGSNAFAVRDRLFGTATPDAAPPAVGRVVGAPAPQAVAAPTSLRSQPWWQDVITLEGAGTTTAPEFTIAPGAVQWRVRPSCEQGRVQVRAAGQTRALVDATCPVGSVGYGTRSGPTTLQVVADGPWRLEIAQQIDAPLVEPPRAEMTAPGAAVVAAGSFYDIDKTGTGKVAVYRHADGRYSLRLEDFFVTPNSDLELRLSPLEAPRASPEFEGSPSELVVVMDVTAGSLNYMVPPGVDPTRFRSVVVWCAPVRSAYAAAPLEVPR